MDRWTNRHTDLPTDKERCRVACPRLKISWKSLEIVTKTNVYEIRSEFTKATTEKIKLYFDLLKNALMEKVLVCRSMLKPKRFEAWSDSSGLERADLRLDKTDLKFKRTYRRPKTAELRPERIELKPKRADSRSERPNLKPERPGRGGQTKPLCSTELSPLWGRCPNRKFVSA